jgi:DHA1 family multidrug resistance protein-like MFS transporter
LLFTLFGVIGLMAQTFCWSRFKSAWRRKVFKRHDITAIAFVMFVSHSTCFASRWLLALVNCIVQTLIPTILSQETDEKSQGSIMGLNSSYQSIGMILGPIVGGAVATVSIPLTFLVGSALVVACYFLSFKVLRPDFKKETAF